MPGRPHIYTAATITDVPESGANTETVVLTLAGCTSEFAGQQISFAGVVQYTPGATVTAVTVRIRQDTLTGTIVGEAEVDANVVAAKNQNFQVFGIDPASEIAGRSYVLTVQGTGEGGAGTATASQLACTIC